MTNAHKRYEAVAPRRGDGDRTNAARMRTTERAAERALKRATQRVPSTPTMSTVGGTK